MSPLAPAPFEFPIPSPPRPSLAVPACAEGCPPPVPLPAALERAVRRGLLARAFRGDPLVLAASRRGAEPSEVLALAGSDRELAADALVLSDGVGNAALAEALLSAFPDLAPLAEAMRAGAEATAVSPAPASPFPSPCRNPRAHAHPHRARPDHRPRSRGVAAAAR